MSQPGPYAPRHLLVRLQFKSKWAHRVQAALRRPDHRRSAAPQPENTPVPISEEWDVAYARVESYLRAHHIESRVLLNHLTADILVAAREVAAHHPAEAPVTLAIRVAQARIGEWLVEAMGEGDWADERFRARGRLALLLSKLPRDCPERFLATEKLPGETRVRLREAKLKPGPDLNLASMPSAPLEFPLSEVVEEKWSTFNRSTFFIASMSWLAIASLAGALWLTTR